MSSKPRVRRTVRVPRAMLAAADARASFPIKRKPVARKINFTNYVKNIVKGTAETKYVSQQVYSSFVNNSGTLPPSAAQWLALLPDVSQGTGTFERDGNQISPTSIKTDFHFNIFDQDTGQRVVYVKLLCMQHKTYRSIKALQQSAITGTLLDNGDGTTSDFNTATAIIDDQKPINKSEWTVLAARTFKLIKNGDPANFQGTTLPANNPTAPNLMQGAVKDFSITFKKVPKLKYDLPADVLPTNYGPVFQMVYYASDGTPIQNGQVACTARTHMWYKDI